MIPLLYADKTCMTEDIKIRNKVSKKGDISTSYFEISEVFLCIEFKLSFEMLDSLQVLIILDSVTVSER